MLALIGLIPMAWRLIAVGGLVLSLGGFLAWEHHTLVVEGEKIEQRKIEDANAAERAKAKAGSDAVDGCFATGGTWDRDAGVCSQPAR